MNQLKRIIANLDEIMGMIFLAFITIGVTIGVLSRLMGSPLTWSGEIARYSFIWTVFLGACIAAKNSSHIAIDVFTGILPERMKKICYALSDILSLIMLGTLSYYGFSLAMEFWNRRMSMIPISIGYVYISLPLCSTVMFARTLIGVFRSKKKETEGG